MLEFRKCHLFFSCGTMKFFLFLLFHLLLLDSPQGLTISQKRSARAVNTSLVTNFNGTYERRNPCTDAEIEKTSYVASHEFRHHAEENNLSDYTRKCSSIISNFIQALGNLVQFNSNQSGIFNFHINTSISQKQDGHCESGTRNFCKNLPTITIEATGCEISPTLSDEQLRQGQKENTTFRNSLNEVIHRGNQVGAGKTPRTFNLILNSSGNTPQWHTENEITSVPPLDVTSTEDGAKLLEEENAGAADKIFQPVEETVTAPEPEFPTADDLMRTENTPQGINNFSENDQTSFQTEQYLDFFKPSLTFTSEFDPENYVPSQGTEPDTLVDSEMLTTTATEDFSEPSPSHSNYLPKTSYFGNTTPRPNAAPEPFYPNQLSNLPFGERQPTAHPKQLFDDNLDVQEPDSEYLLNQQSDTSFISPDQIPKAPLKPQKPISTDTYEPKNMGIEVSPVPIGQNEESFPQSLQRGRQFENPDEIRPEIDFETETTSQPSRKYLTTFEEPPFSQMANTDLPQVSSLTPNEKQFMDYDYQTPPSGFSASYPIPPTPMPPIRNTPGNTLADEKALAIDYPDEFFKAQPELEDSLDSPTLDDASSYKNDQGVSFSDNLSDFNIRKPVADPTSLPSNERFQTVKSFDDVNDNRFFSTTSPERPPFLTSESQKLEPYYSEDSSDESSTDNVTEPELSLPSEPYQSTATPESQSLPNYSDQYDNVEEAKYIPESNFFDSPQQTTRKPYLTTQENQVGSSAPFGGTTSPLQYSAGTTSIPKFSSSYDSTSDYESYSPSGGDTFSDERLTTFPSLLLLKDSSEDYQQNLTTLDPYQDQSSSHQAPSPSALDGKYASTSPGQILNEDVMSSPDAPIQRSKQSSSDIFTSPTSTTNSFDDYQDSIYSKSGIEPTFTTPMPFFNEDTYEPVTKPDENTYSDDSWSTIPTNFGKDQLQQQPLPFSNQNSDPILEQPLNNSPGITLPPQNYETPKMQPPQIFEKLPNSFSDVKPFSDFSTESAKTDSSMNYDSEMGSDSFLPPANQYEDDNVFTSDQSERNPDVTPYFPEDFNQENPTVFSPQPFIPPNNKDRSSFEDVEIASSPNSNTADDYFQSTAADSYQKPDLPEKFLTDSEIKPEKFLTKSFTTPLPPISFPSEDFSSSPNYKTTSENPPTQSQIEESSASLEQFVDGNLPPQSEKPLLTFSAPFINEKEFGSNFQTEKNFKQSFEPAITGEKPRTSTTTVYESQNDQPFSYSDPTESVTPYPEEQYVLGDPLKVQADFFPKQKSFPKPLTSDLSEYESTNSEYQLTEEPADTELNYSMSDSDDLGSLPVVDQQSRDTSDEESTLNYSNQFSDFYPKEASTDFFPSTESPFIPNFSDLPKEQTEFYLNDKQPSSVEVPSLVPTTGDDQYPSSEFPSSPESASPYPDDKPPAIISGKTPLDISSQVDSLSLTKNQELQSHHFPTPDDSSPFVPDNQPQKVPSYSNFHSDDSSKVSQSTSVEDFESVVSSESHFTKPKTFRNMNRAPNRQSATKFKTFQPPQRELEIYNQFSSPAPFQSTNFDDREILPSDDYLSTLKSTSQIEPSVNDYNKQINPYSGSNVVPQSEPYQYQSKFSTPTLLEEYSDITPTAETETPIDIEETTAPSVPEGSPLKINDQDGQEKMSEYSSFLAPERRFKSQPTYDSLTDIPNDNIEEPILSEPQNSDFENTFSEVRQDKSVARNSYERKSEGTDYNQPTPKDLDYLDESLNPNFDEPIPGLSNRPYSSVSSPPPDSVPNMQFRPDDLSFSPQPPASTTLQLNNNLNKPSQQSGAISFRYPQPKKEISFVTDKISPQSQQTTAVYNDEEITEMSLTSKPQPQTSLNFADQFSDDNIPKQLSDSPDQEYQITPGADLPSEFEPVPSMNFPFSSSRRNTPDFSISDNVASNQPSFQSQARQPDVMTGSADQGENNSDSKQSSEASAPSPLYTTTQSQRQPSINKQESVYNGQEQFLPFDQLESQPTVDFNNRLISAKYQQDSPIPDRFSSKTSPRGQRYFNEDFPYLEPQRLRASGYGQQSFSPRGKFQPQPYINRSSRYQNEDLLINSDRNNFPSRQSGTQRFGPQPYPMNFPNQYLNYNARTRPNLPISNLYNEPSPQHITRNAMQPENSFRSPLPFNLDQYPKRSEIERSPDQTSKSANSPFYNDYDQALFRQLPNEKLLEYDEDFTPELLVENPRVVETPRHQSRDVAEEDPREGSNDYLTEDPREGSNDYLTEDPPLGFNRKPDSYDFQDSSSPNNEPSPFTSPPAEKEPHSNPLLQTLKTHLSFPFPDHPHRPASHVPFADSLNDSFMFDSQNEFRNFSAVPSYSEGLNSELDFVNNQQRLEPLNGVDTPQDVTITRQPDSLALVSDPNIPSNKPGEDCVSRSGQIPTSLSCPFDPILKGNMTAPSYYIVVTKSPLDDDKERFKVEKVYLGDGMPLNCTLSTGKTFPTSLYTPIPFAASDTVKLPTEFDLS